MKNQFAQDCYCGARYDVREVYSTATRHRCFMLCCQSMAGFPLPTTWMVTQGAGTLVVLIALAQMS
jgi:hypothetical protein